jgi:lysophospholipase L1-like esterase
VDVIRYVPDVIYPYNPKQIVIYCGENDIAYSDTVDAPIVLARFSTLFGMIHSKWPNENVVFISIKPSPSRAKNFAIVQQANELIKAFLANQKNTSFVDVYNPMLGANGKPIPDIFVSDSLHMNAKGYAIWQKVIQPVLAR